MYENDNKTGIEEGLITKSPRMKNDPNVSPISKHKVTYCVQVTLIGISLHCISDGFAFGISGYSTLL